jgi:hypothetical protein
VVASFAAQRNPCCSWDSPAGTATVISWDWRI